MFDIAPDHAIGLYVGLFTLPLALIAIQLRRPRDVSGTVLGASVLMAISGAIHLGLVLTHRNETITAALFVMNGVAYLALSQLYSWRWWRPASAALITMTLFGYLGYIVLGFDTPDQVALATKLSRWRVCTETLRRALCSTNATAIFSGRSKSLDIARSSATPSCATEGVRLPSLCCG